MIRTAYRLSPMNFKNCCVNIHDKNVSERAPKGVEIYDETKQI